MSTSKSELERTFDTLWRQIGGPELDEEVRFHDKRRFRIDRASRAVKVGIELDGGTWVGGRHTTGAGFSKDCEKFNLATLAGWRIFRLTTDMLASDPYGHLMPIKQLIESELE